MLTVNWKMLLNGQKWIWGHVRNKSRFFSLTFRFLRVEAKSVFPVFVFTSPLHKHAFQPDWSIHSALNETLLHPDFWLSRTPSQLLIFQQSGKILSVLRTLVEHCQFL